MPIIVKKRVAKPVKTEILQTQQVDQTNTVILPEENSKIKPWNRDSKLPYLEFWVSGKLIGASHVEPEYEAEIVARFYKKHGVRKGTVRERITTEKRLSLFNPGARYLC